MGLRQEKFARQLQKDISELFIAHKEWIGYQFVTVSLVKMSPDLGYAKVYLSLFNSVNKEKVFNSLDENAREIRMAVAKKIKNQIKKVPEITFFEDNTMEVESQVEELLNKIKSDTPHQEKDE